MPSAAVEELSEQNPRSIPRWRKCGTRDQTPALPVRGPRAGLSLLPTMRPRSRTDAPAPHRNAAPHGFHARGNGDPGTAGAVIFAATRASSATRSTLDRFCQTDSIVACMAGPGFHSDRSHVRRRRIILWGVTVCVVLAVVTVVTEQMDLDQIARTSAGFETRLMTSGGLQIGDTRDRKPKW